MKKKYKPPTKKKGKKMNTRVESKHLFSENTSPYIKRLVLMKRSGIELSERDKRKLERFTESVSMVTPPPKHERDKMTNRIFNGNDISDIEDEEIDLDEILKEMGYDEDEMDITQLSKSELKELIRVEVRNYFDETFEDPDDLDLNEIIEKLTQ